ncbi:MAG: hypothetical protein A3H61_03860 [Candidatus Jacksonbacteria bacterium RIFCSPLOWO2_02_FULL_44_20]|uniref:Uncharacterized protein n=1 Tax=Candidatus Jacksonbacteria bacterium RIFCSPLOWO2_02_FULL_44_20 TaxID=1798460 RepID=A0A1G2ABK5_9BACT|nr:MAG: hypothetical protein A3H61_03860 [Candidatus Jacksonbacteria bacterium RIFCSPLOWO2_02_FULL_44_20]HCA66996.1 hypothetical protein [Candidatus Jacksonbacteria bacterium]
MITIPMAETSSWKAAMLETLGDAVLVTVGLGYLSRRQQQQQTGVAPSAPSAPKSPFDIGPIGGLTMQDEINYNMVLTRWQSGLDADGTKDLQDMMDKIGKFGIGQRKAIKMRIAGQFSDIVKLTLGGKTRTVALTPAEITKLTNEIKASIPAGTTIDQAKLDAAINALKMELTETPIEAINEALDKVIEDTMEPMLRWQQEGKLKENLIAEDFIPEFDGEQFFRDWIKGQRDTIKAQWEAWRAVYGDATGQQPLTPEAQVIQKKLEATKAGAEAENILRPIGREIKNLDANIYDQLEAEIKRIRAITDPAARLQTAQQFKTDYETQHKQNAELAGEKLRLQEEAKRNSYREFPIHIRNPFRRRP